MKVIHNSWFPFGKYTAINIFGVVFAKHNLDRIERNHEFIHTLQQRELLFVGFYLLYFLEWLFRIIQKRNFNDAYLAISFEREAYANEHDMNYKKNRRHFAWHLFLLC